MVEPRNTGPTLRRLARRCVSRFVVRSHVWELDAHCADWLISWTTQRCVVGGVEHFLEINCAARSKNWNDFL